MVSRRILYCLWLVFCGLLYLFLLKPALLFLFFLSLILPAFSFLCSKVAGKKLSAQIQISSLESGKKEPIPFTLLLISSSFLPLANLSLGLTLENPLVKEKKTTILKTLLGPKETREFSFSTTSLYTGSLNVTLKDVKAYDWFGLFQIPIPLKTRESVSILPSTFSLPLSLATSFLLDATSEVFSTQRAGHDPSEMFSIREYTAGDSQKNIHWKLSSKVDTLLSKEHSLPLEDSVVLLWESSLKEDVSPKVLDTMAEVFVSFAQALLKQGVSFHIGWQEEESFFLHPVHHEDDFFGMLPRFLKTPSRKTNESTAENYLTALSDSHSSDMRQVIYLSTHSPDAFYLLMQKHSTVWLQGMSAETPDDTTSSITFTPDNYLEVLQHISFEKGEIF